MMLAYANAVLGMSCKAMSIIMTVGILFMIALKKAAINPVPTMAMVSPLVFKSLRMMV